MLLVFAALTWAEGELPGRFVINSDGDVVCFSQGNLVYTKSSKTWSFAEHQYDVIGTENITSDGTALANQIDLFGWSADGMDGTYPSALHYGVSTSTSSQDYIGNFRDWGNNKITNGGDNLYAGWRTLTADEWSYLIANNTPFPTSVNNVKGIAIIPKDSELDDMPTEYTLEQWALAEQKGVIFLPFTGWREELTVSDLDTYGYYWTATARDTENSKVVRCNSSKAAVRSSGSELDRTRGHAVRLVKAASSCVVTISAEPNTPYGGSVEIDVLDE